MLLRWESSSRTGQSVLTRKLWLSVGTVAVAKGTSWRLAVSPCHVLGAGRGLTTMVDADEHAAAGWNRGAAPCPVAFVRSERGCRGAGEPKFPAPRPPE